MVYPGLHYSYTFSFLIKLNGINEWRNEMDDITIHSWSREIIYKMKN